MCVIFPSPGSAWAYLAVVTGHLWQAAVHVLQQAAHGGLAEIHDHHLAGLRLHGPTVEVIQKPPRDTGAWGSVPPDNVGCADFLFKQCTGDLQREAQTQQAFNCPPDRRP